MPLRHASTKYNLSAHETYSLIIAHLHACPFASWLRATRRDSAIPRCGRQDARRYEAIISRTQGCVKGSPNVVWILLDDVGFGAISSFGGLINTPNIDSLALQRTSLYELPHHSNLRTNTRGVANGKKSSQCSYGTVSR